MKKSNFIENTIYLLFTDTFIFFHTRMLSKPGISKHNDFTKCVQQIKVGKYQSHKYFYLLKSNSDIVQILKMVVQKLEPMGNLIRTLIVL